MNHDKENEKEAIKISIQEYIDGVIERNFSKAEKPWHPEGVKIFVDSDNKLNKLTMIQSKPKDSELRDKSIRLSLEQSGSVENIEYTGNAAIVKVKWFEKRDNKKREYTDYISLLKIKKEWKIVSKISYVENL